MLPHLEIYVVWRAFQEAAAPRAPAKKGRQLPSQCQIMHQNYVMRVKKIASAAKDEELKATRPLVGILHRRMEKQVLLRTKIWVYEQWSSVLTNEEGLTKYLEHY